MNYVNVKKLIIVCGKKTSRYKNNYTIYFYKIFMLNNLSKLLRLLKTFIIYVSMPFRILLIIFIFIFGIYVLKFLKQESDITACLLMMGKLIIYTLSMKIIISKEDYDKYMEYLYGDEKFICLFTHQTLIDSVLMLATFPRSAPIMNKQSEFKYINFDDETINKLGGIFITINTKSNTIEKIKQKVENRKSGTPPLFIGPSGGFSSQIPGNISKFKGNGAFINKTKILPILIKFEDETLNYNGDYGESMIHSYLKLFLVENYKIKIALGDMIEPDESETYLEYKERVYHIINQQYKNLKI